MLLKPNVSRAIENLEHAIEISQNPFAYHILAELIHNYITELPSYFLEAYNLTSPTRECEVSV